MAERISRASCKFCQDPDRDGIEEMMKAGLITAKQLDKIKAGEKEPLTDIFATTRENIT